MLIPDTRKMVSILLSMPVVRFSVLPLFIGAWASCAYAQSTPCPQGMIPRPGRCYSPTEDMTIESPPEYEDRYGVIAFQDLAFGNAATASIGERSIERAKEIALRECGEGCRIVYEVRNQCMAAAQGKGRNAPVGFGASKWVEKAAKSALKQCKKNGGVECSVQHQSCSYAQRVR